MDIKDKYKDLPVKIEFYPTSGAMAMEMDTPVKYLGRDKALGVNAPDRFLIGYNKGFNDNVYTAAMEARFTGMHGVDMKKFGEMLSEEAVKPWFTGRLAGICSALETGNFKEQGRFAEEKKDLYSLLVFKRDAFIRDNFIEHDNLKEQDRAETLYATWRGELVDPFMFNLSVGAAGVEKFKVVHEESVLGSDAEKTTTSHKNYRAAVFELVHQFNHDMQAYGKFMEPEERKLARDKFVRTIIKDGLTPHYEIRGASPSPSGGRTKIPFFAKAQIVMERVMDKVRLPETVPHKQVVKTVKKANGKPAPAMEMGR